MISVMLWLPVRMPRSVETSKMTASVGMCSAMLLSRTWILGSSAALGEELAGAMAQDVAVCEGEAEVLGEARLAGAEEARDPDGDALVGLLPGGLGSGRRPRGSGERIESVTTYSASSSRMIVSSA